MNSIGLIIWGCKGGHRVFCSNGIVDYKQKAINDTIKDIRSFVRYNLVNLTTYALEFTNDYKVFTIYRSCNDNGTGAYVAITVYVPHKQKVANLRLALDTMMDSYFKEFIHPVFGTYYDGKYDDIELFSHYIQDLQVEDDKSYKFSPSVQDDKPHLMLYEDVKEVDNYFVSPYRKEFFKCQEVMFMSMDLYNKRPETLRFNFAEEKIAGVSTPENLPQLYLGDNNIVKALKIDDINADLSKRYTINASTTNVTITLGQKYCRDNYIVGNVASLIEEKKLQEKDGVIALGSNLPPKEYIDYTIRFTVNQQVAPEQLLYIQEKGSSNVSLIKNSEIKINGSSLDKEYFIGIRPYPNKDNKLSRVHTFIPSISVANQKAEDIKLKTLQFTVNFDKKISDDYIYVYLEDKKINIKFAVPKKSGEIVKIFLPKETDTTALTFDVDTGETEPKFDPDKKILYLSPKVLEFELYIPGIVKSAVQSWDFLILGKSKKKSPSLFPSGNSFKIKLNCNDNIKEGKLIINNVQYQYEVTDAPNPRITPLLLYVQLVKGNEGSVFEYTPYGKEYDTVITKEDRIFPYRKDSEADIIVDTKVYEKSVDRAEKPIIIIQLGKKNLPSNANSISHNEGQEGKEHTSVDNDERSAFELSFMNCAKFHIYGQQENKIVLIDGTRLSMKSIFVDVFDNNEKKVITIFKDKEEYKDEIRNSYEDLGFFLKYRENGCFVKYRKPKKKSMMWLNFLRNRLFVTITLSFICLMVIVLGLYLYFNASNNAHIIAYGRFVPNTTEYNERISKIQIVNSDYLKIDKVVHDKDTIFMLNVREAKEGERPYGESILVFFEGTTVPVAIDLFNGNTTDPDINIAIKNHENNSEQVDTVKITVPTPIETTLLEMSNAIKDLTSKGDVGALFETYNNYAHKVKNSKIAISRILVQAQGLLKEERDYDNYLIAFKEFASTEEYKSVHDGKGVLEQSRKDAAKEAQRMLEFRNRVKQKKDALQDLSCNSKTVSTVEKWYKGLSPDDKKKVNKYYNFQKAFSIYRDFFKAQSIDDTKKLLSFRSVFGSQQFEVIKLGFCKSTSSFQDLQGGRGKTLNFDKSYKTYKTW